MPTKERIYFDRDGEYFTIRRSEVPEPDKRAVEYHNRVNEETKQRSIETRRYVTVEHGQDAINATPGTIGLTYTPAGEVILTAEPRLEKAKLILDLVKLANERLDEIEKSINLNIMGDPEP